MIIRDGTPMFDIYIETLNRLARGSQWCAAGIGAAQRVINEWSVKKGGHARTGLEDNVRLDRQTLAPGNAAFVRRAVELCDKTSTPCRDLWTGPFNFGPDRMLARQHL